MLLVGGEHILVEQKMFKEAFKHKVGVDLQMTDTH